MKANLSNILPFLNPSKNINIKLGDKYDASCLMQDVVVDSKMWSSIISQIDKNDIHEEKGIETEHHITLIYGIPKLQDLSLQQSKELFTIVNSINITNIFPKELTIFNTPDSDVLVLLVYNSALYDINKRIAMLLDIPESSHESGYKPHFTIAYLKKGSTKNEMFDKYSSIKIPRNLIIQPTTLNLSLSIKS